MFALFAFFYVKINVLRALVGYFHMHVYVELLTIMDYSHKGGKMINVLIMLIAAIKFLIAF